MNRTILVGVALVLAFSVGGAAPAAADPGAFNALNCSCQQAAPAGSPVRADAIARGILQGLSDGPAVTRPR